MERQLGRREMVRMTALAGVSGALLAGRRSLAMQDPQGRDLMQKTLAVPAHFTGMHFHRWPEGSPLSPAPTYQYGTVRSHDYGVGWSDIQPGPDQFKWDRLDTWVRTHASQGKTLIYTVYSTPKWASTMPTIQDGYGHFGSGAAPSDFGSLATFVKALVSRYNGNGKRQIQWIEIWNEPHFNQNQKGFWWGTPEQLAQLGRTVYQAAKQTDPKIKVLSPGFDGLAEGVFTRSTTGVQAGVRQYLEAQDGVDRAGAHWMDALAIHTYNADIKDGTHGLEGTLIQARTTLKNLQVDLPVYTTETGYTKDSAFAASTPTVQATTLRRQAAVQAAYGVKAVCFYSHDDPFIGNPSVHPEIATAINDINSALAGASLQQVTVLPGGAVQVKTATRSYTW